MDPSLDQTRSHFTSWLVKYIPNVLNQQRRIDSLPCCIIRYLKIFLVRLSLGITKYNMLFTYLSIANFLIKGILRRVYTQNIDALEFLAGLPEEKVVEAHGTFQRSYCTRCRRNYDLPWVRLMCIFNS